MLFLPWNFFDTDSKINYAINQVTLKTPLGNVPGVEHQANMQTLVKTGLAYL